MATFLALLLASPALAQDNPWDALLGGDKDEEPAEEEDDEEEAKPAEEPAAEEPPPADDQPPAPWGAGGAAEPADPPADPEPAADEPAAEDPPPPPEPKPEDDGKSPTERLLEGPKADVPWLEDIKKDGEAKVARASGDNGHRPQGNRVQPLRAGHAVTLTQQTVFGADGGSSATTIAGRWGQEDYAIAVGVPFTRYRTPDGGQTDLGNLRLDGWYFRDDIIDDHLVGFGLETHINIGDQAYTWVNEANQLWPGGGVNAVFQAQSEGDLKLLYRGHLGVHGSRDFQPFPAVYGQFGAAFGIDQTVYESDVIDIGAVGEAAITYWDMSPFELTGLVRAEFLDGVRVRTGLLFPVLVWAGATPAAAPSGLRESTWVLDLSISM